MGKETIVFGAFVPKRVEGKELGRLKSCRLYMLFLNLGERAKEEKRG